MKDINDLFKFSEESWIEALPKYQHDTILELYSKTGNYEEVANIWLTASIDNTIPFGTKREKSVFFNAVLDEFELFITGDEKYEKDRIAILSESTVVQNFAVGVISTALAPFLGSNAVLLAPVISIIFCSVTKIGLNAWISKRASEREEKNSN